MKIIEHVGELSALTQRYRAANLRIGFVPTMGFLHAGHARLIEEARAWSDVVVVSIFVNPIQFGPAEDLASYPRDLEKDLATCQKAGADVLFHPAVTGMYPFGFQTKVNVSMVSQGLCGDFRPGHFEGVATVVLKFFNIVQPQMAFFGEKDFQQLQVIKRMVLDLGLPVSIVGVPTVREPDGLAMSSRNSYLSSEQRQQALMVRRALLAIQAGYAAGERNTDALVGLGLAELKDASKIDYVDVREVATLTRPSTVSAPSRAFVAAYVGKTRLIDNLAL